MHILTILDGKEEYSVCFEGSPTVQQVFEVKGIAMPHPCGGSGRCGKCVIEISGEISDPDERELALDCRLSCRTRLYGDARVVIGADVALLAEGATEGIDGSMHQSEGIGAAVDIGTTTVALAVYDLTTGKCLASETILNPQSVVAADVIGRIDAAGKGKLSALQGMVVSCIQAMAERTGHMDRIDKWCITGNTTMLYLLQGENPHGLAVAPYVAEHLFGEETDFLGKAAYLPACMHAFVGADITCAVLNSGMCESAETALLCDIGTNGEIALWKDGKLYTASTAAGPVFEGAGISCGCQSVAGAIEKVTLREGALSVKTIGDVEAVGLCGSGVIDTVACLLDNGTIDETGFMEAEAVLLCENVSFNREDIRNVQLAKAAIAAGIRTLLEITDTQESEVSAFYIAGGFGSHLNIRSAVRIGLFPAEWQGKVKVLGNASLKGAAMLLADDKQKEIAQRIAKEVVCINLGGMPEFNENYIDEMFFPERKLSLYLCEKAEELGFSHVGLLKTSALEFRQEVRDMCAAGRCGSYGKRWTCPPYCGSLEESIAKAKRFDTGIVLQMTGNMEDDFDVECMQRTEQAVKDKLEAFVTRLKAENIACLPMSAGTCTKCASCTCPDEPCRFPEKAYISMEAYGLIVNDACRAANVSYNYGAKTITFTTCVLFNEN